MRQKLFLILSVGAECAQLQPLNLISDKSRRHYWQICCQLSKQPHTPLAIPKSTHSKHANFEHAFRKWKVCTCVTCLQCWKLFTLIVVANNLSHSTTPTALDAHVAHARTSQHRPLQFGRPFTKRNAESKRRCSSLTLLIARRQLNSLRNHN